MSDLFAQLRQLQESLVRVDEPLRAKPRRGVVQFIVRRFGVVKIRMRPEQNHTLPHVHIEYRGGDASYRIDPFEKLAGTIDKRHLREVTPWVEANKANLLATWEALRSGEDVRELIIVIRDDRQVEVE